MSRGVALIVVRNSKGECRACDAECYNDRLPGCDCVCGGVNHGVGLKKARAWTQKHGADLAQRIGAEIPALMF